ncbi:tripartite tricarboxylate transporter permease [Thermodesulfobacteriota bacterium]
MAIFDSVIYGFSVSLAPPNLLACFIGVLLGTLIGVLPGLGPVAAISLLLPLTFKMSPVASIVMLAGIYYGAQYGGSTTSILVNIPGEATSVVTCLDGYQMARQGRAGPALGIAAFGSFIAGTLSVVGVMLLAPVMVVWAVKLDAPDYSGLFILGLTLVTYLASKSKIKAVAMAIVGLLLSTIGFDPMAGTPRFDFGSLHLLNGIELPPLAMGLFGIGEVLINIEKLEQRQVFKAKLKNLLPSRKDWRDSLFPIGRGTLLGFFLGIFPGVGAIIPTFLSYTLEKRISKTPEQFGKGMIQGVAGPESANNAASGATLIPMLSLGIPPNVNMALLMGALMIHGVMPGPLLAQEHPEIFWGVITSMYTGNIMLLVLNLPLIPLWVRILRIPYYLLFPAIFLFCIIGIYSVNNSYMDVVIMGIFGVVGYLMRKYEYEPAPLVLAFVLGDKLEEAIRQTLIYSRGNLSIFIQRPMSAIFLMMALALVLSSLLPSVLRGKKKDSLDVS